MNKYMEIASNLALDNLFTKAGGPFGACIVKDGKIIGRGSNNVLKNNDPTAHAEIMAIRDACNNIGSHNLSGSIIYTNCYPCPMCLSAIIWANIKEIYYGNTKEDVSKIGFRDDYIYEFIDKLNQNKINDEDVKLIQIDRDNTIKVLDKYNNQENKTIY